MSTSPHPDIRTVPAATVVIFRRSTAGAAPELLMVQRAKEMRFAGGAAVFPGGRIDPADRELAALLAPQADPDVTAARIGGIRETLEETGLAIAMGRVSAAEAAEARALAIAEGGLAPVLDRFGWTLDLDALIPWARWCPQWEGAFDARFFLYDLGSGAVDIEVDATENTRLFWLSAADALAMAETRRVPRDLPDPLQSAPAGPVRQLRGGARPCRGDANLGDLAAPGGTRRRGAPRDPRRARLPGHLAADGNRPAGMTRPGAANAKGLQASSAVSLLARWRRSPVEA